MTPRSTSLLGLIAAIALGGCAFVPREYPRLNDANRQQREAQADSRIERLAPAEMRRAQEALEMARIARDTLDDPAVVDHLAYLARQRLLIARATAELRSPQAFAAADPPAAR